MSENLIHRFRIQLRWPLILLIGVAALIWLGLTWLERIEEPPPRNITWSLASSTQHAEVLWLKQVAFYYVTTANDNGVVFMIPLAGDSLMAIDVKTGTTIWEAGLPFVHQGISGLVAN